jgi:dUTP pyrophosphatase
MKLLVRPLTEELMGVYYGHSSYNEGDSGLDLFFPSDITLKYGDCGVKVDLGIQCEGLDDSTDKNISYYLYPRSSISKTPIRMSNSVGIIDSGYRGNIIVALDHIDPNVTEFTIQKGTRLFQICGPSLDPISLEVVGSLSDTERGNGGFGSTGA